MTKILPIFLLFFGFALKGQNTQITIQADWSRVLLNWADQDKDPAFVESIELAHQATQDQAHLFFKAWRRAHVKQNENPIATYFDETKELKIKQNHRDQISLRKLKRSLHRKLKADAKSLKAFCKTKGWKAKVRYKRKQFAVALELPKEEASSFQSAMKSEIAVQIYPVYNVFELLGDAENKGPLLRLDSLWQSSGDPSEALPRLEKSILEIADLGYVHTKEDPFVLHVHEEDSLKLLNYLRGFLTHTVLPEAIFLTTIYPHQEDNSAEAYYSILGVKNVPEHVVLTQENLLEVYTKDYEWGNALGFIMNESTAKKWANLTKANVKKALAIVIDNHIYSYPIVQEVIPNGRVEISGDFDPKELEDLKNKLLPQVLPLYWKIQN
jgi:hypothetical protein